MKNKLIEWCAEFFLRDADQNVIRQITDAIESVDGGFRCSMLIPARARTGRW